MQKVPLTYIYNRVKVEFVGEDGIDSGGLGKEAFLLLARDAAKYAGPGYKNWLVVHKTAIMASTAVAAVDNSSTASAAASSGSSLYSTSSNGGLFFTDDDKEKDKKIGGGGGGSGGMKGKTPDQKRQLRNNHNNNSNNNNSNNDNHDPVMPFHSVEASLSILEEDDRMDRQAFFLFLGRFVAKALYDRQVYDRPFIALPP